MSRRFEDWPKEDLALATELPDVCDGCGAMDRLYRRYGVFDLRKMFCTHCAMVQDAAAEEQASIERGLADVEAGRYGGETRRGMSDVRVPREAIEAATQQLIVEVTELVRLELLWTLTMGDREATKRILEAALPFLRAQWEADLLSDKAIEQALHRWDTAGPIALDAEGPPEFMRSLLRAALGSRFVPEEPKDAP